MRKIVKAASSNYMIRCFDLNVLKGNNSIFKFIATELISKLPSF